MAFRMISVVKARLVEVLGEALPETKVIYGPRDSVMAAGSRVLTVGTATGRMDPSSLGGPASTRQYTVELNANVAIAGTDQQAADEMALADFEAAVATIDSLFPDLGLGEQYTVRTTGDFELSEVGDPTGRIARVRFYVDITSI